VAIAPLLIRIRTLGAAALSRTAAQLRAFAAAVRAAAARAAAAARSASTYTAALRRLGAALRAAAVAAMLAARIIGGQLVRALRQAARAAGDLIAALIRMTARFAAIGTPIIAVVAALVPVIGNLIGLVQLLAPAVVAAGLALVTLKLGFSGVGTALKAGLSGDTEEFEKALKKLEPAAADTVRTLVKLRDAWKPLQQRIQGELFAGAAGELKSLSDLIRPIVFKWLPQVAMAFARVRNAIADGLARFAADGRLEFVFRNIHRGLSAILEAIPPLARAFGDVLEVAAPRFGTLGEDIRSIAQRFSDWIRTMKESGDLGKWLDNAKKTFGQLKDIGAELGRVLSAIFKGVDGEGFLEKLKNSIAAFADWLESENGQNVIKFFSDVAGAIAGVISWIEKAVGFMRRGWDNFREATEGLRNAVVLAFASIGAAGSALFAIISGGVNAFSWIGGVIGRLSGLVGAVRGAVSAINAALSAIRTTVFIDIITRRFEGSKGYAKGIGGGSGGGGGLKFYAKGGPVAKGQPIVVGDGGRPELFVPNSAGTILPRVPSPTDHVPYSSGSGSGVAWSGSMSGLDAMFFRWFNHSVRTGKLKLG